MTLLLLAGTGEARRLAWGLADSGLSVRATMAGATRHPEALPIPTDVGGFGGEEGFRTYLRTHKITAVLDATHPFATRITERTAQICQTDGIPYCHVLRPGWAQGPHDRWTRISTPAECAKHIPIDAVVFLATGRQTLADYANLEGRRVLARVIDPPTAPFPFEGGEFVIGRPPFPAEKETALFRALGVTHLVSKDAGSPAGRGKLDAARDLGLPVILLDRKAPPEATRVSTVGEAMAWVKNL